MISVLQPKNCFDERNKKVGEIKASMTMTIKRGLSNYSEYRSFKIVNAMDFVPNIFPWHTLYKKCIWLLLLFGLWDQLLSSPK